MLKIRKTTKGGGLKALEQKAKEAHGLVSDVGVTSKTNRVRKGSSKKKPLTMAQLAQILERGWVQRITAKQVGFFRHNFGINLKKDNVLTLPPRPFLTLTAKKQIKYWRKIYINSIVRGGKTPTEALSIASKEAVDDVRSAISNGGFGGIRFKERSPMTMKLYRTKTQGKNVEEDAGYGTTQPLFAKGGLYNSIAYLIHKRLGR